MSSTAPVVMSDKQRKGKETVLDAWAFSGRAAAVLYAGAALLLVGSAVDLGVLWILQRQGSPQWEFVATSNTLDSSTRIAIAFGMLYVATVLSGTVSMLVYRVLGTLLIAFGIGALALGALVASDYFALVRLASDQAQAVAMLKSSMVKSVAVAGIAFLSFTTAGIFSLRRPKGQRR